MNGSSLRNLLLRLDSFLPRHLRDNRVAGGAIALVMVLSVATLGFAPRDADPSDVVRAEGPGATTTRPPPGAPPPGGVAPVPVPDTVAPGDTQDTHTPPPPEALPPPAALPDPGAPAATEPDPAQPPGDEPAPAPQPQPPTPDTPAPTQPAPTAPVKGITDDTMFVGIPWSDSTKATLAFEAAGTPGLAFGNIKNQAQLLVDYVNSQGGVAGRQLEPVWFERSLEAESTPESADRQYQAMCAAFTEDNQVYAIMNGMRGNPVLTQCAARSGTYEIAGLGSLAVDQDRFSEVGDYFYQVNHMITNRRDQAYIGGLVQQGFFTSGATVGLLVYDDPSTRRSTETTLKPLLTQHGLSIVTEAVYTRDGFFASGNNWPAIVFQFQSAGVTHVLFSSTDQIFGPPLWFMQAAEHQLYRPYYGVATDLVPGFLPTAAPRQQLRRVTGIGWRPDNDGVADGVEELADQPNNELCRRLMREAGEPEYAAAGVQYCEVFFFLKTVLDTPGATLDGFPAAVHSLGNSYSPVLIYGTYFEPGRHDGAHLIRDLGYDQGCECFVYTSGLRESP